MPEPDTSGMEPQVVEALTAQQDAVREAPRSADAWGRLGMIFQAHGLENEAAVCYEEAAALDPGEARWPYLLAHVLRHRDPGAALAAAERALALDADNAYAHHLRGELLEALGRTAEAEEAYRRAVALAPELTAAVVALGRIALEAGRLDEARLRLDEAVRQQPYAGAIHAFLARLYRLSGDRTRAAAASEKARSLEAEIVVEDPILRAVDALAVSTMGLERRARYAEAVGDVATAEALHRRLVELHPDDPAFRYNLANFLGRIGRRAEAEAEYRRVLAADPDHVAARVNLGLLLLETNRADEAIALLREALARKPDHVPALVNLSGALFRRGATDEALALVERALELEPDNPSALLGKGQILAVGGRIEEGLPYVERALARFEDEPVPDERRIASVHAFLAEARLRLGDAEAAWRHVEAAESLGARIPDPLRDRIRAAMAAERERRP